MNKFFNNIWFKCISTLLIIALFSGGLLSILSDVLYVSAEERTSRAVKKLYNGIEQQYQVILDADSIDSNTNSPILFDNGQITKIFMVGEKTSGDYDLLLQSTGNEGFKNGTITVWVKVNVNTLLNTTKIVTVLLDSYDKQTLMSQLGGSYYDSFLIDISDKYDKLFTSNKNDTSENYKNIVTGATKSANAGCNAVNNVIKYMESWEK